MFKKYIYLFNLLLLTQSLWALSPVFNVSYCNLFANVINHDKLHMRSRKRSAFFIFRFDIKYATVLSGLGCVVGEGAVADASVPNEECDKDGQHVRFLDLGGLMCKLTLQMCLRPCHSPLWVQPPCQTPFRPLRKGNLPISEHSGLLTSAQDTNVKWKIWFSSFLSGTVLTAAN